MVAVFSFDFEAQGPNPATHGVNGLGIVVFDQEGNVLERYETGIRPTNGRQFEPGCKTHFWDNNPEALKWVQEHQKEPWTVVEDIVALYKKYKASHGGVKWVAWPAAYDWGLLVAMTNEFAPQEMPSLGFKCICASALCDTYAVQKNNGKKPSLDDLGCPIENPHFPGSDAEAQGKAFFKLAKELNMLDFYLGK